MILRAPCPTREHEKAPKKQTRITTYCSDKKKVFAFSVPSLLALSFLPSFLTSNTCPSTHIHITHHLPLLRRFLPTRCSLVLLLLVLSPPLPSCSPYPFHRRFYEQFNRCFLVFFCLLFFFFLSLPRTPYYYSFAPSSSLIDVRFECPQLISILSLYIAQDTEKARRYSSSLCYRFFFLRARENAECFDPRSHTHIFHFFKSEVCHPLPPPLSFPPFPFSFYPPLLILILTALDVVSSFFIFRRRSSFSFHFLSFSFPSPSNIYLPSSFLPQQQKGLSPLQSREKLIRGALKQFFKERREAHQGTALSLFHNAPSATKVHRICIRLHLGSVSISKTRHSNKRPSFYRVCS